MSKETVNSTLKMDPEETRRLYFRAEFKSMGDVLGDGRLNHAEFIRLMRLLGLYDEVLVETIWSSKMQENHNKMTSDEYVEMMESAQGLADLTSMWRKLYSEFDTDGSGYASRNDVITGLKNMGITVSPVMRAKIYAMDADKDDRIYYGDFLKMQLLHK